MLCGLLILLVLFSLYLGPWVLVSSFSDRKACGQRYGNVHIREASSVLIPEKGPCEDRTERAGSGDLLLLLPALELPTTALGAPGALSSPLPGELVHLHLQTVDLVSEVLLEEPVV